MAKLSGLIKLIRPINSLVMGFAILVGVLLAATGNSNIQWLNLLMGSITAFSLTAAAMVINDYHDYDIDKINEPTRPIPSGAVSKNAALVETGVLSVIGLAAAYYVSLYCFVFAFVAWIIMATYSTVGKRSGLPGNFLVSACVAAPFLYGSLIALNMITVNVLLFASMAFLSNTGREIAKGNVDVYGDRSYNIKTMAVRFGEKKAAYAAAFFFISAVILTFFPIIFNLVSIWFIPFVLVTDIGLIWCSISLIRDPFRENARKIKRFVLYLFIFGLLSFIAGMFG
ncbi:MAG: geranylgeranylglycerol-phosphate geranylgeranyltransferase [Candidatus Bathyarchaeia archaeon]